MMMMRFGCFSQFDNEKDKRKKRNPYNSQIWRIFLKLHKKLMFFFLWIGNTTFTHTVFPYMLLNK